MEERKNTLPARCFAEVLGTYILIFFGCGALHTAVLADAQAGIWQVAIVWGVAIVLAGYVAGGISGAHINPAITVALASWGRFSWNEVLPYVASQVFGAFLAAATLFTLFNSYLAEKEAKHAVIRGQPGSEITAMCYGEYFPSPGPLGSTPGNYDPEVHAKLNMRISEPLAFLAEVLGTLFLALVVFAVTDERNLAAPISRLAPVFIGLDVAILISVLGPLTQACLNPARDFGPRLFAYFAGWGAIALPGRGTGFLTVYIVAPLVGAVLGGGLYVRLLRPYLPDPRKDTV